MQSYIHTHTCIHAFFGPKLRNINYDFWRLLLVICWPWNSNNHEVGGICLCAFLKEDCVPSAFCTSKVTKGEKKEKSWDERMSAASLEDDDVVLHADADPECFFFLLVTVACLIFSRSGWLRPSVSFPAWKYHCILLTFTECIQCNNVL